MGFYSSFIIRFESMVQLNGALEAVQHYDSVESALPLRFVPL